MSYSHPEGLNPLCIYSISNNRFFVNTIGAILICSRGSVAAAPRSFIDI